MFLDLYVSSKGNEGKRLKVSWFRRKVS